MTDTHLFSEVEPGVADGCKLSAASFWQSIPKKSNERCRWGPFIEQNYKEFFPFERNIRLRERQSVPFIEYVFLNEVMRS